MHRWLPPSMVRIERVFHFLGCAEKIFDKIFDDPIELHGWMRVSANESVLRWLRINTSGTNESFHPSVPSNTMVCNNGTLTCIKKILLPVLPVLVAVLSLYVCVSFKLNHHQIPFWQHFFHRRVSASPTPPPSTPSFRLTCDDLDKNLHPKMRSDIKTL